MYATQGQVLIDFNLFLFFFFCIVKNQLQERYKDVASRIIIMALESVDYSQEKACKILEIVMQDDKDTAKSEVKQEIKEDAVVENEASAATVAVVPTSNVERYIEKLIFDSNKILWLNFGPSIELNEWVQKKNL